MTLDAPHPQSDMDEQLRAEAAIEPDPVPTVPATKQTQIIAIYGKGGIGKSFTLANLSYMMAQQGKRVLLIGCDPKSDTTSLLFEGRSCPTIIETSSRKKAAGENVVIGDVCFKRDGVFAMGVKLDPASAEDMCGGPIQQKASLEVIYDERADDRWCHCDGEPSHRLPRRPRDHARGGARCRQE